MLGAEVARSHHLHPADQPWLDFIDNVVPKPSAHRSEKDCRITVSRRLRSIGTAGSSNDNIVNRGDSNTLSNTRRLQLGFIDSQFFGGGRMLRWARLKIS